MAARPTIRPEDLSQLRFVQIAVWVWLLFLGVLVFLNKEEDTATMTAVKVSGLVAGAVVASWALAAERRRHLRDLGQDGKGTGL
jgi:hypothetical protein